MMNENNFFDGFPESRLVYDALIELVYTIGPAEIRMTRSQIALVHTKPFAWIWIPEKHLRRKATPLVLSLSFPQRDTSPRWKQIVEPAPDRYMHHLEIYSIHDLDKQVLVWLKEAWKNN